MFISRAVWQPDCRRLQWKQRLIGKTVSGLLPAPALDMRSTVDGAKSSPEGPTPALDQWSSCLIGTAACASYDVVTILEKSRQPVTGCVAKVSQRTRAPEDRLREYSRTLKHALHRQQAKASLKSKVARAVELSAEKYCSASIMMKRAGRGG